MNFILIEQYEGNQPKVYGPGTFEEISTKFLEVIKALNPSVSDYDDTYWTDDNGYELSIGCIESL